MNEKDLRDFKDRIAGFSEHYPDFLIAAKNKDGELMWKSSDKTWAIGVCTRYINCSKAADQFDEVSRIERRNESEG